MVEDIIKFLEEKAKDVDKQIEKILPRVLDDAWCEWALDKPTYSYDKDTMTKGVIAPIYDLLDRGGKRWRPALMLLCVEAVGGNPNEFLELTALPELIHNGTLIVDDVEDDSELRRGKPCIHKSYGADIAINAGNAMYYLPLTLLYKNTKKLKTDTLLKMHNLISQEMIRLHFGQGMDIYWHQGKKKDIKEIEYLQMCAFKTGMLARMSARLGVILGNGSEKQELVLGRVGESVGVAFQIQDDVLDLVGEKFAKGKGLLGGDIHEGKRTIMVLYAINKLNEKDRSRLIGILDSHPTDQKIIDEAISLIKKSGAIEYAKKRSKEIVLTAWKDADKVLQESEAKKKIKALVDYLIERDI
jgi:geranylgeranyl pyrophosphate synthase